MPIGTPTVVPIGRGKDGDAHRDAYRRKAGMLLGMPIGRVRDAQGCL